ncbi:unnamed protein product [Ectocarpus sp. 12 AP-2014]
MFEELTLWANSLNHYRFNEIEKLKEVKNGIYLVFENGEQFLECQRIVRVGSHPSQDGFYRRLHQHFNKKQRSSIMRKHFGRCFLNANNDTYLPVWNLSNSGVAKGTTGESLLNSAKEYKIESEVSKYLKNLSIAVISNLNNQEERMELEKKLIATLSQDNSQYISDTWLGLNHPNHKIVSSGMWNVHHIDGDKLITEKDFSLLKKTVDHG